MKDHLGSNRVVASTTGEAEQVNHYYPYGSTFYGEKPSDQRFKYCGKELDKMHGLDWYDSSARYYDHLLATKEFWVGGPKITNFYYTGNTLFVESDGGLRYYWNINGTQFSSLSPKYYPLADGTYNVSVYTTSPNCGAGPTYTTQLHVSGGNMYSLGAISSDHQVSIETIDYSDSPQPLEAMQTMTSKQAAKDVVPYELKNAMTGEVSARGEMPAEGGVLDFSRVRSGLYVLTISPAGREPETFKISLK